MIGGIADLQKQTDKVSPMKPVEQTIKQAQDSIEQLTRRLERQGIKPQVAQPIAEAIEAKASGPISLTDWATLEASRFSRETKNLLKQRGLTADQVLADSRRAEDYAQMVFKQEGIPDGSGGTEKIKNVLAGQYDNLHGLDLVAVDKQGVPIPVEVKKYNQPSAAYLENKPVAELKPEVEAWRQQREAQIIAARNGSLSRLRPDVNETWKPEVKAWRDQIERDASRMVKCDDGKEYLPVQQMDDLWVRDRWLRLIQTPEGREQLHEIGVADQYLNYDRLRSSPDLPEWHDILDRRTAVIVSGQGGDIGKTLFHQAIFEKRVNRVVKIEV